MTASTLYVCISCRGTPPGPPDAARPGARLLAAVERLAAEQPQDMQLSIVPVECLSNCQRGCSAAIAAPGKWTYVIGDLDPDRHAGDIVAFARLHQGHQDGLPVWRERPAHVRKSTIARVPPMLNHSER
ncbi:DUF1636 family protein [Reyranella sp.]|uniref:DUF1636 family protein n=1 Tax=Reyranella sp. TaxID=1929291 RepID=UPI003BACCCC8